MTMANFGKDLQERCVHIRSAEQNENFTVYIISVTVGSYAWIVKHRYSEFHDLHEKLSASYKLDKTLLPPKKLFGNQTEAFIKKRQRELEIYLQTIILCLAQHIPSSLAYFLDFDKYEIHGITQAMAEDLYNRGENLLQTKEQYEVTSLQLYALTERLKLPEPTCDSGDVKKDLGHILDFITRSKYLKVTSGKKAVGTSNIIMNKLPFDLTLFKSLQTLEIIGCNFRLVNGLETVKQTVTRLNVHESSSSLKEILLQDSPHWKAEDGSLVIGYWDFVVEADFSHNSFSEIPDCIQLMPNIEKLDLSYNIIETIQNLQWLSQLTHLDLSHNCIKHVDSLHTKMGNVKVVKLAHNGLESLHGFAKLFSLEILDVSHNKIAAIEELRYISQLPCVEDLLLIGNAVTNTLDYRTKTLEMFGDRVREIILDKQPPDQKELDTVAVLQALRKAKDIKIVKRPKKNMSAASLSEYGQGISPNSPNDNAEGKVSRTESPAPGVISRSVPSISDWSKKDQPSIRRSTSPYSQDSLSSQSDAHEEENENAGQHSVQPSNQSAADGCTNNNNSHLVDNHEDTYTHELIPEAHPFDLTIENPASNAYSLLSSSLKKSLDTAVTPPATGPVSAKTLSLDICSTKTKSGSEPLDPKGVVPSRDLSHSLPAVTGSPEKRSQMSMYNVADLPTLSSEKFTDWLMAQLLGDSAFLVTSPESRGERNEQRECVIDVLWCYVEQFSKPGKLHPCCIVLTKSKIFIEEMVALRSCLPGVPMLKPFSILPIGNIQQMLVGSCHGYIRLEEAFVGKSGTLNLFAVEPLGLRRFVSKFQEACSYLHVSNCPEYVNLSLQSDLLKALVSLEEESYTMPSDRLSTVMLIRLKNSSVSNLLVLSENSVYCLDTGSVYWPPTSFDTTPDKEMKFNVIHQFSISDAINDIKIHPVTELTNTSSPVATGAVINADFTQFELSLEVTLSADRNKAVCGFTALPAGDLCQKNNASISYLFPSAALRDAFLDRLTCLRAEQANRMSPNLREEPEGGNELLSPSDNGKLLSSGDHLNRLQTPEESKPMVDNLTNEIKTLSLSDSSSVSQSQVSVRTSEPERRSLLSNKSNLSIDSEIDIYDATHDDSTSLDHGICYSASPKDDLSVSPMSNFSRASISPPLGQQAEQKKTTALIASKMLTSAATKADSLPSSFNWKDYYFKSSGNKIPDNSSQIDAGTSRVSAMNKSSLHLTIPGVQEDFESSSEFDHSMSAETEHEVCLRLCLRSYDLVHPLPTRLKPLCLMNGRELRQFFHSVIALKTADSSERLTEELHHVLWSGVIPYTNPKQEIITLVMLSTHCIYLVSDTEPQPTTKSRPSWMTHSRNKSDSAITWKSENGGDGLSGKKLVKSYFTFKYSDLQQVNIGMFDQCVRLTGGNENSVFTIATRDSSATVVLIQKLKYILSLRISSPMVDKSKVELEQDFYGSANQRVKSTLEGTVYVHPSKVNFIYPGEDAIRDILFLVREKVYKGSSPKGAETPLWFYLQCYQLLADDKGSERAVPRTLIVTQSHICVAEEDTVTYPLPDFVRGLPENPCHEILECHPLDCLKRVTLFHANSHWVSLTFYEEMQDIVVDVSVEHFSHTTKGKIQVSPEFTLKFFVQSVKERDKCVRLLEKLWKQLVSQVGLILDVSKV